MSVYVYEMTRNLRWWAILDLDSKEQLWRKEADNDNDEKAKFAEERAKEVWNWHMIWCINYYWFFFHTNIVVQF